MDLQMNDLKELSAMLYEAASAQNQGVTVAAPDPAVSRGESGAVIQNAFAVTDSARVSGGAGTIESVGINSAEAKTTGAADSAGVGKTLSGSPLARVLDRELARLIKYNRSRLKLAIR